MTNIRRLLAELFISNVYGEIVAGIVLFIICMAIYGMIAVMQDVISFIGG